MDEMTYIYCLQQYFSPSFERLYYYIACKRIVFICYPHSESCMRNSGLRQSFLRILRVVCCSAIWSNLFMRMATSGSASLHFQSIESSSYLLERPSYSILNQQQQLINYSIAKLNGIVEMLIELNLCEWGGCGVVLLIFITAYMQQFSFQQMIIYISLQVPMTNLQNKSHGFQQTLNKSRNQYTFHSKFKCEPYELPSLQPQFYYSDEEGSVKREEEPCDEMEHLINQVQGQIERNLPQPEIKSKKVKSAKKRGAKNKANKAVVTVQKLQQMQKIMCVQRPLLNQGQFEQQHPKIYNKPSPTSSKLQKASHLTPQQKQRPQLKTKGNSQTVQQSELHRLITIKERVDRKFVVLQGEGKSRQSKEQICFRLLPDYRAYFEKQTKNTYEQFLAKLQQAKNNVVKAKIRQMVTQQKQSKLSLIEKIQSQSFRNKRVKNLLTSQNLTSSNLQAIQSAYISVNHQEEIKQKEGSQALNKNTWQNATQKPVINKSPPKSVVSQDSLKANSLQWKRKDKPRASQAAEKLSSSSNLLNQFQMQEPNKNLEFQLSKMNDRKKILASIQMVNQQCEEHQKHLRIQSQRQERERQQKQKYKVRKQPTVHSLPPQHKNDVSQQNQSERRRQQNLREAQWYSYHKSNPKIKRLQILNRYHYNPFEENEGQDQCELWKKLMSIQIKNLRYDSSVKNQQGINQHLIDELLRDAEECDRQTMKLSKLNNNDIFILPTNYKPPENDKSQEDEEQMQNQKSKKSKSIKKSNKHKKNKKNKESKQSKSLKQSEQVMNNSIDHFLDFGGTPSKNVSQDPIQDFSVPFKAQQSKPQSNISQQNNEAQADFQQAVQHLISNTHNETSPFHYDQLPDLQINEQIKKQPNYSDHPFQFLSMDYLQNLSSKQGRRLH